MKRIAAAAVLTLAALYTSACGAGYYSWTWLQWPHPQVTHQSYNLELTTNNGSHAVALGEYGDEGYHYWTSVAARLMCQAPASTEILGYEWKDGQPISGPGFDFPDRLWWDYNVANPCVSANNGYKLWMSATTDLNGWAEKCKGKTDELSQQSPLDEFFFTRLTRGNQDTGFTGVCFGGESQKMLVAYTNFRSSNDCDTWGLHARQTTDAGGEWDPDGDVDGVQVFDDYQGTYPTRWPSLAIGTAETAFVVYRTPFSQIVFERSTNSGQSWPQTELTLGYGDRPCIAAVGSFVFVCWQGIDKKIRYLYSMQSGSSGSWSEEKLINGSGTGGEYTHPNVSVITCGGKPGVLFTCQVHLSNGKWLVLSKFGRLVVLQSSSYIAWQANMIASSIFLSDPGELRPSVATVYRSDPEVNAPFGAQVFNYFYNTPRRSIDLRFGQWKYFQGNSGGGGTVGRLIAKGTDGSMQYASTCGPHIVSGPADTDLLPGLVAPGSQPALALDADGDRWVSYVRDDTVWTMTGDGGFEVTFAGSISSVPGQPSMVCYPNQANGVYVGNVVFPVYDTVGGASKIMYARVDTCGVVLDTIESVNTLRDSLPCISIYKSDTLVCTYQHGDSILSRLLPDYGPSSQGQPGAWSSANLVSASGYHPMSVMENGSVVSCCYAQQNGGYSIQRATCDLSGGMFPNWVAMTAPSATSNVDKGNPVYAGVGASVWQQMVSGKWAIKAFVRGAETALVANDTDAYHPHAVAESSAASPSIDRIRLHLLYDAGVAFEVDSGVYDTGEVRYAQFDFDVSNAGPDGTRANNGSKLMRKEGSDSLFAAYQDADGTVMYAWSAAGDSWRREVLATSRCYPAIATDSTGKRWVASMTPDGSLPAAQYLYYQSGGSWASQSLYSGWDILGPASLAGASSTTTGIAYSAFKVMGMLSQYIVLTKYNGTTVAACTLATGANLGDPSITVEPYKTDSDHVHVTWEDNGVIKYRMDTDGRSSGIANKWTSTISLSDGQVTSHHPSINCDRDQIVAAWAQGATAEIYSRKRLTSSAYNSWDAAVNLSNTPNNASDWPTVAMGDTVVVAWEETRSGNDHDILACINFGDTLNVADNATVSGYPHVLFQNKASGDTCIPYLHTIWSETPSANYYEVGYNKLNLKQASGEGQQSASSIPIPVKPMLEACQPNPFRGHTQINYALPKAGNVSLQVFDVSGRTVRTFASGHQKAGNYSVNWDARDSHGKQVPYGVYFYRLDTPGFRSVKKAVVTR
jgi:hypothetical protein